MKDEKLLKKATEDYTHAKDMRRSESERLETVTDKQTANKINEIRYETEQACRAFALDKRLERDLKEEPDLNAKDNYVEQKTFILEQRETEYEKIEKIIEALPEKEVRAILKEIEKTHDAEEEAELSLLELGGMDREEAKMLKEKVESNVKAYHDLKRAFENLYDSDIEMDENCENIESEHEYEDAHEDTYSL